ncbi:hypothetical protein BURPS1106B_1069 [Burkholderia pseudomallei 1106b]|uniref:Uncharacterized protein n=3 Tax=Pseudomonadota TaxID=1224 RepID=A0A0E1VT75_BURPE|nr:hypothetical protein BURPS1106A_A0917 [Burkholderia pseudomallei 1106a]EDS82535.1 hypothetical protein BURPSS13_T0048 [Burkholderia pseudomallei S13]EEH28974.1 conserved hypothetical protein [Burkholderia pseudomallei Pakistan 9]EES22401.1 hypothetical protein BURPS1106B_1069 [Burkholderia pseudomallei 1106b]EET03191.1 hypothetical protein BURPS1710A_A0057 [Burkholderia pseudomallei 1710a]
MVKGYRSTGSRRPSVGRILRRKYSLINPACSAHFFPVKN